MHVCIFLFGSPGFSGLLPVSLSQFFLVFNPVLEVSLIDHGHAAFCSQVSLTYLRHTPPRPAA